MRGFVTLRSLVGSVGVALVASACLAGCGATSSGSQSMSAPQSIRDDGAPAAASFVGVGSAGRSGEFGNVVTIFSRSSDLQRECLGCRSLRVIYDGVEPAGALGVTRVNTVRFDLTQACGVATITDDNTLKGLTDDLAAASLSTALDMRAHPRCRPDGIVRMEFLAKACLNGGNEECVEPTVREVYETTVGALLAIAPTEDLTLPNRVQH